jgi:hypothetical protein
VIAGSPPAPAAPAAPIAPIGHYDGVDLYRQDGIVTLSALPADGGVSAGLTSYVLSDVGVQLDGPQQKVKDLFQASAHQIPNFEPPELFVSPLSGAVLPAKDVLEILDRWVLNPKPGEDVLLRRALGDGGAPGIPYADPTDECFARAHAVCYVLQHLPDLKRLGLVKGAPDLPSLAVGKLFVEGNLSTPPSKLLPQGAEWTWHVTFYIPALDPTGKQVNIILAIDPAHGATIEKSSSGLRVVTHIFETTPEEFVSWYTTNNHGPVKMWATNPEQYTDPGGPQDPATDDDRLTQSQVDNKTNWDRMVQLYQAEDPRRGHPNALVTGLEENDTVSTVTFHCSPRKLYAEKSEHRALLSEAKEKKLPVRVGFKVDTGEITSVEQASPKPAKPG